MARTQATSRTQATGRLQLGGGATSQGANNPGTMADDATVGVNLWNTPDNAKVEDGVLTIAVGDGDPNNLDTHYLKATNFGFSIPTGATIDGIIVEVKRRCTTGNTVHDKVVSLLKAGSIVGDNKADTVTNWTNVLTYITYGAADNLWGISWNRDDINNTNFGIVFTASSPIASVQYARVDHIRITVYYTEGGNRLQATNRVSV